MRHPDDWEIFAEGVPEQRHRLWLQLRLGGRVEIEREQEDRALGQRLDVLIDAPHLRGDLDRQPEGPEQRQQDRRCDQQEDDPPVDPDHAAGEFFHWSFPPPRDARSMPRVIFIERATCPLLTPMRMARRTPLVTTFSSHWVMSPVQGSRNWPQGTRPIITSTADTSSTDASGERARKAR